MSTHQPLRAVAARTLLLPGPTDLLLCDPSYLLEHGTDWQRFITQLYTPQGQPTVLADGGLLLLPTGGLMLYGTTAYGDGCYPPSSCGTICTGPAEGAAVDSGMLCLIAVADALAFAGPASTAFRPELSLHLSAVHGMIATDGRGRFIAPAVDLVVDTAAPCATVDGGLG